MLNRSQTLTVEHDEDDVEFEVPLYLTPHDYDELFVEPDVWPQWFVKPGAVRHGPFTREAMEAMTTIGVRCFEEVEVPVLRVSYVAEDDDHAEFEFGEGVWSGIFEEWQGGDDSSAVDLVDAYKKYGHVFIVHREDRGGHNYGWTEEADFTGWSYDSEWDEWRWPEDFSFGDGFHVLPEDVMGDVSADELAKASTAVWDEWTKWANGDVWGIVVHTVGLDGTVYTTEALWNMIGREYAEAEAKEGRI